MAFDPDQYLGKEFSPDQYLGIEKPSAAAAKDPSVLAEIDKAFMSAPGVPALAELASSANRSVLETIDFFGTDIVNRILYESGSDLRLPSLAESAKEVGIGQEGFVEEGLGREALKKGGEAIPMALGMGTALRGMAAKLPSMASGAESVGAGILRQLGQTTAKSDVGLGAVSGAGAAVGEEIGGEPGALIGSFLAPVSLVTSQGLLKNTLGKGVEGIKNFFSGFSNATRGMSEEGASKLLGEALVREGISPDEAVQRMAQLGDEAIPADIGTTFTRLLNAASRKVPRIEGAAGQAFAERQAGQSVRILDALDDATGTSSLSLNDEIVRLDNIYKPRIDALYAEARASDFELPQSISKLIAESPSLAAARKKASQSIRDMEALGKPVGQLDVIDQTKRQIDDQIGKAIRDGENNRAMDLADLKNAMVSEVDNAVPAYKAARDMYAGKAQLESAGDLGEMFFKIKPSEIGKLTSSMSESEKKMFRLGAKQAIVDKIESLQTNADAVKRMFGKTGDVKKLKALFGDDQQFQRFSDALERESRFILTRNMAQKTSGTPQQLIDVQSGDRALADAADIISNPAGSLNILNRIFGGLRAQKGSQEAYEAWAKAGDILLESGMATEKLKRILTQGKANIAESAIKKALGMEKAISPIGGELIAEQ